MLKKLLIPASIIALGAVAIKKAVSKHSMPLIGDKAPCFVANSTMGKIVFPKQYKGSWVILFSHPADFTPVCTTEFMVFQNMQKEFKDLNTELIGLSVDSLSSHMAWIKNIKDKIHFNGMANLDIKFPVIDDMDLKISKKYGMIHPNTSGTKTVRAVFIIDPDGIIRAILYYPQSNGRNINEIKRLLVALQSTDEFGTVTPANWKVGDDVIIPPPSTKEDAQRRMEKTKNLRCLDWFLCFKKMPREMLEERLIIE